MQSKDGPILSLSEGASLLGTRRYQDTYRGHAEERNIKVAAADRSFCWLQVNSSAREAREGLSVPAGCLLMGQSSIEHRQYRTPMKDKGSWSSNRILATARVANPPVSQLWHRFSNGRNGDLWHKMFCTHSDDGKMLLLHRGGALRGAKLLFGLPCLCGIGLGN